MNDERLALCANDVWRDIVTDQIVWVPETHRVSFDRVLLIVSGRVAGSERVEVDVAMAGWPLWGGSGCLGVLVDESAAG